MEQLGEGVFRAICDDPQLIFKKSLHSGWYLIHVNLSCAADKNAKIYYAENYIFNETNTLDISFKSGRDYKRLVYIDKPCTNIRFDPCEVSQDIKINHFSISRVFDFYAKNKIIKKLSAVHPSYKGLRADAIKSITERKGHSLYDEYQECFTSSSNIDDRYLQWMEHVEDNSCAPSMHEHAKLSIVMPVYNANVDFLDQAISSIKSQTYSNWELCIADDGSENGLLKNYLKELIDSDSRIQVTFRSENGHISEATNTALSLVTGDYVIFMDQDDLIAHDALICIAKEIDKNKSLLLIYTDEDKVDEVNKRFQPHFKPAFSPDLLLGQNYINHLTCMKASLIEELGGLRKGYEGAQDHDLLVRALPKLSENNVKHIPKVLYHWRAIAGSTALSSDQKSYTQFAALKSINDYIQNNEQNISAKLGRGPNTLKLERKLIKEPLVSILIPTRDGIDVLKPCLDSLFAKTYYKNFEVLVLDNDSRKPETHDYLRHMKAKHENIRVIACPGEFNYSAINNLGASKANGDVIVLLNNDIEIIESDWLCELVSNAIRPDVGCVGAKLLYPDGRIQHGGVILGLGGVAGHSHLFEPRDASGYFEKMNVLHEVSAVTAACLAVRKSIYFLVDGLDESLKVAFNDVDFCIKVREKGYRNLMNPYATLVHHESVSRGYEDSPEKQMRFNNEIEIMQKKWGQLLSEDPYYNVNFDLFSESYQVKVRRQ